MASLLDEHKVQHLQQSCYMAEYKKHMIMRSLRHWPEDFNAHMQQHLGPLWMASAASAEAMNNGC
eukprot:200732-Karenia_brevis.AAC.1